MLRYTNTEKFLFVCFENFLYLLWVCCATLGSRLTREGGSFPLALIHKDSPISNWLSKGPRGVTTTSLGPGRLRCSPSLRSAKPRSAWRTWPFLGYLCWRVFLLFQSFLVIICAPDSEHDVQGVETIWTIPSFGFQSHGIKSKFLNNVLL